MTSQTRSISSSEIPIDEGSHTPRGAISSETQPPVVLKNLPVCGNCHSFSADGSVLGMEVDSGNDKGAYAIVPVEEDTIIGKDKIVSWSD